MTRPGAEQVRWIYEELLGRVPSEAEVAHQTATADDLEHLIRVVLASEEWQARRAAVSRGLEGRATDAFVDGLRLLNDSLAAAGFADRYWLWAGLLIGWARDGLPLPHDAHDADFCVLREDIPAFAPAAERLFDAGFVALRRFRGNDGRLSELTFARGGAQYEFFVLDRVGVDQLEYLDLDDGHGGREPVQATARIARQPLEPITYLGRRWLKHRDHESELAAMYGAWRIPDPGWHHMCDRAIVRREPWRHAADLAWDGSLDELTAATQPG